MVSIRIIKKYGQNLYLRIYTLFYIFLYIHLIHTQLAPRGVQYKNITRTNTTPYIAYLCYMFISRCIRQPINRGQIVLCRTLCILRLCTCNVLDDYIPIFNVNNA